MSTLNLTTADNSLTLTINGTTIKQLWAKNGSADAVQVYQKWKDESYSTTTTNTEYARYSYYAKLSACSQTVKYRTNHGYGAHNYYTYYYCYANTGIGTDYSNSDSGFNHGYITLTYNGSVIGTSSYLKSSNNSTSITTKGLGTYYSENDSSYYEKKPTVYLKLYIYKGSSYSSYSASTYCPSKEAAGTGTNYATTSTQRAYRNYTTTTTGTRRVQDN